MTDRTCQDCGEGLEPGPSGRPRTVCSTCKHRRATARVREWRRAKSPRGAAETRELECVDCGTKILAQRRGNPPKRCKDCRRSIKVETVKGIRARQYIPPELTASCIDCGAEVKRISPNGPMPTRCTDCAVARKKLRDSAARPTAEERRAYDAAWRARNPNKVAAKNHMRRAARLSVMAEHFEASEIFERDGWTCQICGQKIDPAIKWPDLRSLSLDHVIPISLGGAHRRDNVQLACLGCNLSKGNRMTA